MGAVVVHHQMQFYFDGKFSIQTFQEFEKLLMTMPGITLPNHFTLRQFERRKERRGAVALVVMGHGPTAAFFQRQSRLRAIQCLNLTFLVHAEHQCLLRRIEIETHHIGQFLQKPGITRQFERLDSVRLKTMTLPDPVDRCLAHAMLSAIVRQLQWVAPAGLVCSVALIISSILSAVNCGLRPRPAATSQRQSGPSLTEALPPQSNRLIVDLHALGDILVLLTFRCRQYYPTALCNLLRRAVGAHPALQLLSSDSVRVTGIARRDMK